MISFCCIALEPPRTFIPAGHPALRIKGKDRIVLHAFEQQAHLNFGGAQLVQLFIGLTASFFNCLDQFAGTCVPSGERRLGATQCQFDIHRCYESTFRQVVSQLRQELSLWRRIVGWRGMVKNYGKRMMVLENDPAVLRRQGSCAQVYVALRALSTSVGRAHAPYRAFSIS